MKESSPRIFGPRICRRAGGTARLPYTGIEDGGGDGTGCAANVLAAPAPGCVVVRETSGRRSTFAGGTYHLNGARRRPGHHIGVRFWPRSPVPVACRGSAVGCGRCGRNGPAASIRRAGG